MAEVSAEELASWLNVSRRRVNQLVKEGVLPKRGTEGHPLQESVVAYIRFLQAPSSSSGNGAAVGQDLAAIRLERQRVALQREQLELHQAAGALIAVEDAAAYVVSVMEAGRTVLQLTPRKYGTDAEERAKIKALCGETLNAMIDASANALKELAPVTSTESAAEEDDDDEAEVA